MFCDLLLPMLCSVISSYFSFTSVVMLCDLLLPMLCSVISSYFSFTSVVMLCDLFIFIFYFRGYAVGLEVVTVSENVRNTAGEFTKKSSGDFR